MTRVTHVATETDDLNAPLETVWIGFVGNDAQGAGLCCGAEQRALWSRQCFHATDIHHPDVRLRAVRRGDGYFVEIDRRALCAGETARGCVNTAEDDEVVAPALIIQPIYAWHEPCVVFCVQGADCLQH